MSSVIEIIGKMIWTLITEGLGTIKTLTALFQELLGALLPISAAGPGGLFLAGIILFLVAYFIIRFIFKTSKTIIILIIIGIVILLLLSTF